VGALRLAPTAHSAHTAFMRYRPLFHRLIVFTTPVIERRSASGLYVPNGRRGTYSSLMRAWVAFPSRKLENEYKPGQVVIAQDAFEFEPLPPAHNQWPVMQEQPEFAQLKLFSEKFSAQVEMSLMFASSILAIEDDFDAHTCSPVIETRNYQHFVA
jgi:hypothetical protein